MPAAVDGRRLWERHLAMAKIGRTERGGVNRQALTPEDAEGRNLLLSWAAQRNYSASIDAIGNLFVRRPGLDAQAAPVMTGSHLDSQPTGGNFDGVFGVLAGLEVLETLDDNGLTTLRPIELVVWMNEEGARFPPTTMGSAVCAGELPLETALATIDKEGISVGEALAEHRSLIPPLTERELGENAFSYVEAHIEQGPVLEEKGCRIGIVTGIQGLSLFEIEVQGDEAHAGTTPLGSRRDAFVTASELAQTLRKLIHDPMDILRFTIGRFDVAPGSPNTVPGRVFFTIDLRHPDDAVLARTGQRLLDACRRQDGPCSVDARLLFESSPVTFDDNVLDVVRKAADDLGVPHIEMISGATHDAKFMVGRCPTAMIFVPCKDGISHNEAESARPDDLTAGAQLLCATIHRLATAESGLDRN